MSDPDPHPAAIFSLALQNQRESQELSQHAARSTSIHDLLTRLRGIPDAGVRGRAQYALLQVAENVAGSVESALADTMDWVDEDPVWRRIAGHAGDVGSEFPSVHRAATNGRTKRNNIASYVRGIRAAWPEFDNHPFLVSMATIENQARAIRDLARAQPTFDIAIPRLNAAFLSRLETPGRGVSSRRVLQPTDFRTAASPVALPTDRHALTTRARALGLQLNEAGLFQERPRIEPIEEQQALQIEQTPSPQHSSPSDTTRPRAQSNRSHRSASTASQESPPAGRVRATSSATPPSRPVTRSQMQPLAPPLDTSRSIPSHSRTRSQGTPSYAAERGSIERRSSSGMPATPLPRSGSLPSVTSDLSEISLETIRPTLERQGCRCDQQRASPRIVGHFINPDDATQIPLNTAQEQRLMIREFAQSIRRASSVPNAATRIYCYRHTRALAQAVGLRVLSQTQESLTNRLVAIYDSMSKGEQATLALFKVRPDRYTWFIRSARGAVPSDELGPYRFFPKEVASDLYRTLSSNTFTAVRDALSLTEEDLNTWRRDGSLTIPNFFAYWESEGLLPRIKTEFDLYD
jgi:hypothetical protein